MVFDARSERGCLRGMRTASRTTGAATAGLGVLPRRNSPFVVESRLTGITDGFGTAGNTADAAAGTQKVGGAPTAGGLLTEVDSPATGSILTAAWRY